MIPQLLEVTKKGQDNAQTFTLEARALDGSELRFAPGQFNMLYVHGKGEIPISISGHPDRVDSLTHTVQVVGAVSKAFTDLEPGDTFGMRGPFGRGWPMEAAKGKDLLLMAGGLGLAPLRPVLYEVFARRADFRRVVVLYGARSVDRLLFEDELRQWRQKFDLEVLVTLDIAKPTWHGHVGVVTGLCKAAGQLMDLSEGVAFVCGPHIMMRFSVRELLKLGVAPERLYISSERNMKCGVGVCGHCQFGPYFLCKDGPVFAYSELKPWLEVREL
jgi:NAD(P)H-flavin reductase